MSEEISKDPVKMHKEANTLYSLGKYKEVIDLTLKAADLYYKGNNFFDSTSMLYKAGESAYMLKDYEEALKHFLKSADLSFEKKFDRFGVSALEYARDCYQNLGNKEKVKELNKKIKKVKKDLESAF